MADVLICLRLCPRSVTPRSIGDVKDRPRSAGFEDLCRRHGFSEASYYPWRNKFGGMSVPDAKRLKELETENTRLKKLLAEQMFEKEVIQDVLRKNPSRTGPALQFR